MEKGDKKSREGKIAMGNFGTIRKRRLPKKSEAKKLLGRLNNFSWKK